ncbi:MAG: hypothetical protein JWM19_1523 [Actinomycetia bacterium]|nr:hypothetical protein [Actinomycetes bacterium]
MAYKVRVFARAYSQLPPLIGVLYTVFAYHRVGRRLESGAGPESGGRLGVKRRPTAAAPPDG